MASVCPIIYRFKVQWYQGPKHLYSDSPPLFLKVKTANFKGLFTSENAIGCYFQWNVCTRFQKICSWTRYECSNVNRKTTTLVEPFRFCFRVISSKKPIGGYFQWNVCTKFQKIWSWARFEGSKILRKT